MRSLLGAARGSDDRCLVAASLTSDDGGFAEAWNLSGEISQFSQDELDVDADLRALGQYDFGGTYQFDWLSTWPEIHAALILAVYAAPQGNASLEGALQEWSARSHVDDAGVIGGGSGDGAIIKVAAWSCHAP